MNKEVHRFHPNYFESVLGPSRQLLSTLKQQRMLRLKDAISLFSIINQTVLLTEC